MSDDFRALCADLIEAVLSDDSHIDCTEIARRARAALGEADEPAEPIPPAALPEGYIDPEHSGDDQALLQTFYSACKAEVAELYEHRHSLMLALMRALPRICWFSRRHADGELPFGSDDWFIVGAELPGAPITYHLPAALYSLAQKTGALELPAGRPWDGHSAADVVHRLRDWAIEPAPPADREVAELVEWLEEEADGYACLGNTDAAATCNRAAELLERQVPVLVSVSERLPEPKDCDAEGRCWWLALHQSWPCLYLMKADIALAAAVATHWLPAHSLPLPEVGE